MLDKSMTVAVLAAIGMILTGLAGSAAADEDTRELVELPPMMQQHMLANMRDHLLALDEILADLAEGNIDAAASIAEKRLGMSSLSLHGAAQMAPFMPEAMGEIGTRMHHAASQFVIVAQDAELNPGKEAQHEVYRALREITRNCNTCHQSYRLR